MYFVVCNDAEELDDGDAVPLLVVSIDFFDSFSLFPAFVLSTVGVFGVFDDPKLANAPEPRPKAEEAPAMGDAKAPLAPGVRLLKGFDFPCDGASPPNRFEDVKVRGDSGLDVSLLARDVDADLTLLQISVS